MTETHRKEVQARKYREKALELVEWKLQPVRRQNCGRCTFNSECRGEPVAITSLGIDQDVPVIKAILWPTQMKKTIEAIRMAGKIDLIAHSPDFGYATFGQHDTMARIIKTRNRFALAMRTVKWIQEAEWQVCDIRKPYGDANSIPKREPSIYVETLNLATNNIPGERILGYRMLDFRENLWLRTNSILVSIMVRGEYPYVGVINSNFHRFSSPEQKSRVAGGLGATNPQNKRVIGIFKNSAHRVSFLVNRTKTMCAMFDPLQFDANYAITENRSILHAKGVLKYQKVEWFTQQDGRLCDVWCIAVLEMLLSDA
ncbi:hypothetical protein PHPALM_28784 [Phytophthora palmivora]|uniref:Uncharacterized protein n=1 Tax=Phytophthora palmivora TaxID=4796 RepID=A0A2P4X994_9STRA|nr:hypothetical protein PHPALM_28784 [Phytophthora palmivora]